MLLPCDYPWENQYWIAPSTPSPVSDMCPYALLEGPQQLRNVIVRNIHCYEVLTLYTLLETA